MSICVYIPEHPMHLVTSRALLTFSVSASCCIPLEYPFLYLLGCEVVHISHHHVHVTVQTGNMTTLLCVPEVHHRFIVLQWRSQLKTRANIRNK